MVCMSCIDMQCFMCEEPVNDETCCCMGTFGIIALPQELSKLAQLTGSPTAKPMGRPRMSGEDMSNPLQAGRARAEDIATLGPDTICDWSMLLLAGGGIHPIVGCAGNVAVHRHHGPDKSTFNNVLGDNLHRVCTTCHNRWHTLNDEYYGPRPSDNSTYLPNRGNSLKHDGKTQATPEQVLQHGMWWNKPAKERDEYRSWERESPAVAGGAPSADELVRDR